MDLARFLTPDIVTIKVGTGDELKIFTLHEALLRHQSRYFNAAFEHNFKEAQSRKFHFQDDDPEIFTIFAVNLYTGTGPSHDLPTDTLLKLWILSDKLQATGMQNNTMGLLTHYQTQHCEGGNPLSSILNILDYIVPSSPLYHFCKDTFANQLLVCRLSNSLELNDVLDVELRKYPDFEHDVLMAVPKLCNKDNELNHNVYLSGPSVTRCGEVFNRLKKEYYIQPMGQEKPLLREDSCWDYEQRRYASPSDSSDCG